MKRDLPRFLLGVLVLEFESFVEPAEWLCGKMEACTLEIQAASIRC